MEIGLDDWKNRRPFADENFQQGCTEMENIINNPNYNRAFIYSVHSYSDMIIKYYREKRKVIPSDLCEKLNGFFRVLVEMQIDSRAKEAIVQFYKYCEHYGITQYCVGLESVWGIKPRIVMDDEEEDYIDIDG